MDLHRWRIHLRPGHANELLDGHRRRPWPRLAAGTHVPSPGLRQRRHGDQQAQDAIEPFGSFFNLDGPAPFVTWGKTQPNERARLHRNIPRKAGFQAALANVTGVAIDYYTGVSTSEQLKPTLDFVLSEIARPEGNRPKDDVVALRHEKDGRVVADDVRAGTQYPILPSRQKPGAVALPGFLPTWP